MSIDIMNRIWWRDDLPTMEKFVALALADGSNDEGVSWPAIATVAEKCSCSERTVQNAVRSLQERGLLRRRDRADRTSYFIFQLHNLPLIERKRRPKEVGPHVDRRGAGDAPHAEPRVQEIHPTGAAGSMTGESPAPRTVIETSVETSVGANSENLPAEVDTNLFGEPILTDDQRAVQMAEALQVEEARLVEVVRSSWKDLSDRHKSIPMPRSFDGARRENLFAAIRAVVLAGEPMQRPDEVWAQAIAEIDQSLLLTGKANPTGGRSEPWAVTFDWLVQPPTKKDPIPHFLKVLEGNYRDKRAHHDGFDQQTGRQKSPHERAGDKLKRELAGSLARRSGPVRSHQALLGHGSVSS